MISKEREPTERDVAIARAIGNVLIGATKVARKHGGIVRTDIRDGYFVIEYRTTVTKPRRLGFEEEKKVWAGSLAISMDRIVEMNADDASQACIGMEYVTQCIHTLRDGTKTIDEVVKSLTWDDAMEYRNQTDKLMWIETQLLDPHDVPRHYAERVERELLRMSFARQHSMFPAGIAPQVPKKDNAISIPVMGCARCGGNHGVIRFSKMKTPMSDGYSYWASCPTNGDPILLKIKDAQSEKEST